MKIQNRSVIFAIIFAIFLAAIAIKPPDQSPDHTAPHDYKTSKPLLATNSQEAPSQPSALQQDSPHTNKANIAKITTDPAANPPPAPSEHSSLHQSARFSHILKANAANTPTGKANPAQAQPQAVPAQQSSPPANSAQAQPQAVPAQQSSPPDDCCPAVYLSRETVLQAKDDLCTKTCINGLKMIGLDMSSDKPANDWLVIQGHFNKITLIKSHFELNGVSAFTFDFPALKTIEAEHIILEGTKLGIRFLKNLEIVRPSKANCELIVSTTGFPAGPALDRFNAAVAKGKKECLDALAKATPPSTGACSPSGSQPGGQPGSPNGPNSQLQGGSSQAVGSNSSDSECSLLTWPFFAMTTFSVLFTLAIIGFLTTLFILYRKDIGSKTYALTYIVKNWNVAPMIPRYVEIDEKTKADLSKDGPVENTTGVEAKNRHGLTCITSTLVKLPGPKPEDRFINANYVHVPGREKRFIATQGPLFNTIYDFWLMIVGDLVQHIIKVTDNAETNSKGNEDTKCKEYYPIVKGESMTFKRNNVEKAEVEVTCLRSELIKFGKSTRIRKTLLAVDFPDLDNLPTIQVTVWHWLHWPDHAAPITDDGALVEIMHEVLKSTKPIVVHCSAGIGRTGSVIMTGYIMSQMRDRQKVDPPLVIFENLRKCRAFIVQNFAQFLFPMQVTSTFYVKYCKPNKEVMKQYEAFTAYYKEIAKEQIALAKAKNEKNGLVAKKKKN